MLIWLACVLACFSLGLSRMGYLHLLNLIDYFLFHIGEIFNYNLFKIFLYSFFFPSSSVIPIIRMLVHLILSQRSLRLSSVLFILFTLFCSSDVISAILSSSSLIRSSDSDILLLIPSQFSSVQSLSRVRLFVTPWIAARQAFLSITNSRSSLKFVSIELVMPSNHLLCRPLLLLSPIPPSISLFQRVNSSHEVAEVLEFQL